MQVRKRNGNIVDYNREFILRAVTLAAAAAGEHDMDVEAVVSGVEKALAKRDERVVDIETIQDAVEESLFEQDHFPTAKAYILYRVDKEKTRGRVEWKEGLLTREFLSPYKHAASPMGELGSFVYSRTYSRYIPALNRREFWWETVRRAVEYNCSLAPTTREEAEKLYDNVFHLRQFLSGRTLWVGATPVSEAYPMANYNCAFEVIDDFHAFHDLFYLLMIGSGVGVRVLKDDAKKLPKIRTDLEIVHKAYTPRPVGERLEYTDLTFSGDTVTLAIGDSKEGWAQAIDHYFQILSNQEYSRIRRVIVEYDSIRPRGERLKVFGGTASGYESMMTMLDKIHRVIRSAGLRDNSERTQLRPIDLLDIANIIGENVVSGGVRRTSEIGLIDQDDTECIQAKGNLYRQVGGRWEIDKAIAHRQMSNNSIFYRRKPTREQLHWHLKQMRYSGEPGWVNEVAGLKRRPNFCGCNPCGEILLDSHGLCNLTTVNVMAFVKDGKLDEPAPARGPAPQRPRRTAHDLPRTGDAPLESGAAARPPAGLLSHRLAGHGQRRGHDARGAGRPVRPPARRRAHRRGKGSHLAGAEHAFARYHHQARGHALAPAHRFQRRALFARALLRAPRAHLRQRPALPRLRGPRLPRLPRSGAGSGTCRTKVVEFPVKAPAGKVKADVSAIEQLEN